MRMSRVAVAAVVLVSSTGLAWSLTAGTSSAATVNPLPVSSVGEAVVDGARQRILISDPTAGKIIATTYQGRVVAEASGIAGVRDLELSADGSYLYAVGTEGGEIVALSARTLTETRRYPLGEAAARPAAVEEINGTLWFSHSGGFGSLDPATGGVHVHEFEQHSSFTFLSTPRIAAAASAPGLLVVAGRVPLDYLVTVFDVSSGVAVLRTKSALPITTNLTDFSISHDGAHVTGIGWQDQTRVSLTDGAVTSPYPDANLLIDLAVADDGRVALGSDSNNSATEDVFIYQDGAAERLQSISLPKPDSALSHPQLIRGSLAWEPGAQRLFSIGQERNSYYLLPLIGSIPAEPAPSTEGPSAEPELPVPHLTWRTTNTAVRSQYLRFAGTISLLPSRTRLTVTRTDAESPAGKVIGHAEVVNQGGEFDFQDLQLVAGKVTYTVSYPGDAYVAPVSAQVTVNVARTAPNLSINRHNSVNAYGSTVTVTALVNGFHNDIDRLDRTLEIWADPAGADQPARLVRKAKVQASGHLTATVKLTRNTTVTARFAGDTRLLPRTVAATLYTKAPVGLTVAQHYKSAKIGSLPYHYFRTAKDPRFVVAANAVPKRKLRVVVQKYTGGKWQAWRTTTHTLASTGKATVNLPGTFAAGSKFRVRTEYVSATSGDTANYTTVSAWKYFTFTR